MPVWIGVGVVTLVAVVLVELDILVVLVVVELDVLVVLVVVELDVLIVLVDFVEVDEVDPPPGLAGGLPSALVETQ